MIDIPVRKNRLYRDVEVLTTINPPRNYRNIQSLDKIADHILQEFSKLDCTTQVQSYLAKDEIYKNVIASFATENESRIVIGAHYDVDGDQPGADDNASAVAGLLEIARLVHELKPKLRHRLDFVAFSLEEAPFYFTDLMGSAIHASSLKRSGASVKFMLCLEMIGYFSQKPGSQKYASEMLYDIYPHTGNFIALVSKDGGEKLVKQLQTHMQKVMHLEIQTLCAPVDQHVEITLSDHLNYWKEGYEAVMITDTSFLRNPHYHQKSDTIDTLDFDAMAEVVKGVYWALVNV
ncbi:MAG: M28 family peptidase [Microscillaceae bacterium]|nr:M28 family peptidase [Microscillaceae bacterium]